MMIQKQPAVTRHLTHLSTHLPTQALSSLFPFQTVDILIISVATKDPFSGDQLADLSLTSVPSAKRVALVVWA